MKISSSYPPNYEKIVAKFNIKGRSGIIFTYGDTIYNPSQINITPDLIAHEETHERQQTRFGSVEGWWGMYLNSKQFRFEQELAAYRNQYQFAVDNYGREQRRKLLDFISKALAGPMYGNLLSAKEAKAKILS